jgi:hypothetical protein
MVYANLIVNELESNFTVNSKIEINSGCLLFVSLLPFCTIE